MFQTAVRGKRKKQQEADVRTGKKTHVVAQYLICNVLCRSQKRIFSNFRWYSNSELVRWISTQFVTSAGRQERSQVQRLVVICSTQRTIQSSYNTEKKDTGL